MFARKWLVDAEAPEPLLLARPLLDAGPEDSLMKQLEVEIVTAADARRVLTGGDLRSEVAFQNEINMLLARLDEKQPPLRALAPFSEP